MTWVNPDPTTRRRRVRAGFSLFMKRFWLPDGEVFEAGPEPAGVAAWLPPGGWHLSLRRQLAMTPSLLRIAGMSGPRFLQVTTMVEKRHPKADHWYLVALGVKPEHQGRGLGSKLMFPILERCDREGTPAYLESSSPGSRALYERHGFKVTEELRLPKGGPPIWLMWREPS